jgi:hypothetical protein
MGFLIEPRQTPFCFAHSVNAHACQETDRRGPAPLELRLSRPIGYSRLSTVLVEVSVAYVRPLGFEPRTCGLRVRCSAIELEAPSLQLSLGPARNTRTFPKVRG